MDFGEAFKELILGHKITRKSFSLILGEEQYFVFKHGKIYYYDGITTQYYARPFLQIDILANDWEVICHE